jgi:hypothetical protein
MGNYVPFYVSFPNEPVCWHLLLLASTYLAVLPPKR